MSEAADLREALADEAEPPPSPGGGGAFLGALRLASRWVPDVPASFRGLRLEFRPDALLRVPTDDGAHIAMARYFPRGGRRYAEPVVLCHGLGANRFTFDFHGRHALARALVERGFEAWIVELRGRGVAGPAASASFDRQVTFDVGAALRTVVGAGAKECLWVGHSKGGMLALAHLARDPRAPVRAVAAVGSPTSFRSQKGLKPFARVVRPLLAGPQVPLEKLSKLALVVPPPDWFMRYLIRPENLDADTKRRALLNVGADVAGGVGRQFLEWITKGRWTSEDGAFDYERGLRNVAVPTLLMAGTQDLLAPPAAAHHAATLLGGPVETVTCGRGFGFQEDYGHGDLVLGRHAPEEIYPRVISFLERNARLAAQAA
jgi:pimeloyl-ACP methyl ester carboxylesterase